MQTSDAIVIGERRRYLDPTAICKSRHAGPSKWTDDDDMLAGCETPAEKKVKELSITERP